MALLEINFFSKALMRPVTMNVILPADKVFFEEETEEDNKPFKTLYLLRMASQLPDFSPPPIS